MKFFLKFGSEDQKKGGLHPKLHPVDAGRSPTFWAQFSLGGHVNNMAGPDEILSCGFRFLPTISGMNIQK